MKLSKMIIANTFYPIRLLIKIKREVTNQIKVKITLQMRCTNKHVSQVGCGTLLWPWLRN